MMQAAPKSRVVIAGAGMAGLSAAVLLGAWGHAVTVVEKEPVPGGKMRRVGVDGTSMDGGPTVFTMKWVFDRILARAGTRLEDHLTVHRAGRLARHFWRDGSRLDLHADVETSAAAIKAFAGPSDADGYRRFCAESEAIFATLKETYIAGSRPGPLALTQRIGWTKLPAMLALKPFSTLWRALGTLFSDERLRQLFARYSTYCGSSPFLTPATLMLVAHVEQDGVWLVDGGMSAMAKAFEGIARDFGVRFHYGDAVSEITHDRGAATGVQLASGITLPADAVIFNGDVSALGALVHGVAARLPKPIARKDRSLSAMTFCVTVPVVPFALLHHNVFFADGYKREFSRIFEDRAIPDQPTTYICAPDRDADGVVNEAARKAGRERLFLLINAPADGDRPQRQEDDPDPCLTRTLDHLETCGLTLDRSAMQVTAVGPQQFAALFPATGGALYGPASHGWMASFRRTGARTAIRGLYTAGGSVHPGAGVPMAALSGLQAAESLASDLGSTVTSRPADMSGGMPTV